MKYARLAKLRKKVLSTPQGSREREKLKESDPVVGGKGEKE